MVNYHNPGIFKEKPRPDWLTIILFLILSSFGVLNVFSASASTENAGFWDFSQNHGKQLMFMAVALGVGFFFMLLTPTFFNVTSYFIYALVIGLLVLVLVIGTTIAASKSWISIGSFRLQPAEFAKYATVLGVAKYLDGYNVGFKGWKNIGICIALVGLPFLLTLAQNDTGSALVFLSFVLVFYREGMPGYILVMGLWVILVFVLSIIIDYYYESYYISISIIVLGAIAAFVLRRYKKALLLILLIVAGSIALNVTVNVFFNKVLKQYQRDRILVTLNIKEDKMGIGYNVNQSKIAIGAGGVMGRGFMQGTQTLMGFVPEQSTDFIFCTIGEEWGFAGTASVILIYLSFMGRIVYLAERQRTTFSRVVGYGLFSILLIHFFINIGMTLGIVPVIGIPLPFFSYGGSSFIAFTVLLFTFISLDSKRIFEMARG
ncbi:MAG: rod shape-determining protein RodA [Bacteroidia bacterium]|nr:rod shape-determining protein RodA [Bacteroidota bacterium]MCZ2131079.1 rod shape-determining protein RodA [Bacteroidia bacterium]